MSTVTHDYAGFYTIILTELSPIQETIIDRILHDCWSLQIVNVNILTIMPADLDTVLFTYFPYTPYFCEEVRPLIVNRFKNGSFLNGLQIFPEKLNNFFRCPLSVVTYPFEPYTILDKDGEFWGVEGIIFNVLSERLNFTPVVKIPTIGNLSDVEHCLSMVSDMFQTETFISYRYEMKCLNNEVEKI